MGSIIHIVIQTSTSKGAPCTVRREYRTLAAAKSAARRLRRSGCRCELDTDEDVDGAEEGDDPHARDACGREF